MTDIDRFIERLNTIIDRLEPLLPPAIPDFDPNYCAYRWKKNGHVGYISAVKSISNVTLDDLLCIDRQKKLIDRNTRQFLNRLPANNVLLWGPRGTGKSSLIKALLNDYKDQGLKMVELNKSELDDLLDIIEVLQNHDDRFIIFCDDLSFTADDDAYKALKVVLDGSISSTPDNILIYASSNRRHLVPESMKDNQESGFVDDELHMSDSIEEKISLSERFGLWLAFHPFTQAQYLSIVDHWLKQLGHDHEDMQLVHRASLRWALEHGSRSGRSAWQFARDWSGRQHLKEQDT